MGLGAITIGLAVVAVLVWLAVLVAGGRGRAARIEEAPANLRPFLTDDELETTRLNQVLLWALISAAVLAYAVPGYYLGESERQAEAVVGFDDRDVEEGEILFNETAAHGGFECFACHGTGAVGGGATFVEARSGLETQWAAPALNDIFFRYDEDEVRYWITFGRAGTPMPAWGLEGGGPMNSQQIDQIIAYIHSLQISQSEAVAQVEGKVRRALDRVDGGGETVVAAIAGPMVLDDAGNPILDAEGNPLRNRTTGQEARLAEIEAGQAAFAAVDVICCGDRDDPRQVELVLTGDDTCTERSAALILTTCAQPGVDTDRDGLSDRAEAELTRLLAAAADNVFGPEPTADEIALGVARNVLEEEEKIRISLDPADGFSMSSPAGEPIEDLASVEDALAELKSQLFGLRAVAENTDRFLAGAKAGLEFLEASLAEQRWAVDFSLLAAAMSRQLAPGEVPYVADDARRAYGLYNAYCARCHTGGYSAGVAFEQQPGSGAIGPSLREGRAAVQFPDREKHIDFIGKGSENAKPYGINGIGRGWMPGFRFVLSRSDLELIADFERSL